jgi:hypothetical protein
VRTLDYVTDVQAFVDAFPDHVVELLMGWAPVLPVVVGVGVLLALIRRARFV